MHLCHGLKHVYLFPHHSWTKDTFVNVLKRRIVRQFQATELHAWTISATYTHITVINLPNIEFLVEEEVVVKM